MAIYSLTNGWTIVLPPVLKQSNDVLPSSAVSKIDEVKDRNKINFRTVKALAWKHITVRYRE